MSIKRVNDWIVYGKEALIATDIAENNKIVKTFRGHISAFGAAVTMGNLKSAVAFFSEQAGATVARERLLRAICYVLLRNGGKEPDEIDAKKIKTNEIFDYVCSHDSIQLKNAFVDASLALKLAMNLFELVKED